MLQPGLGLEEEEQFVPPVLTQDVVVKYPPIHCKALLIVVLPALGDAVAISINVVLPLLLELHVAFAIANGEPDNHQPLHTFPRLTHDNAATQLPETIAAPLVVQV